MWGDRPVDGFERMICWIRGHEWTGSGSPTESMPVRCERCQKPREGREKS